MNASHSQDPVVAAVLHDPAHDAEHHEQEQKPAEHDQATEVAHAWEHFWENARFFACFLTIILLTFFAFNVNFGRWNLLVELLLAAARSALIAYFLATLFKNFSFVFKTLTFTAFFLAGMIWLSLWDSTIKAPYVGDPISLPHQYDRASTQGDQKSPTHVP